MDDNFNNQNQQPENNGQFDNQYNNQYDNQQQPYQQDLNQPQYPQNDYNQQYQQPQQYNDPYVNQQYPTYTEMYQPQQRGLGIASMIIGICSIVFTCCVPYITFFSSIAGLILGIVSLKKGENAKGMAIAGIVTSACALLFCIFTFIIFIAALVEGNYYNSYGYGLFDNLY